MPSLLRFAVVLALALPALPAVAAADGAKRAAPRHAKVSAPLKDCTRYNGRFGYYGNPWCTPAEQARWDRRETRRLIAK